MIDALSTSIDVNNLTMNPAVIYSVLAILLLTELMYLRWGMRRSIPGKDIATNLAINVGYVVITTLFKAAYIALYFVVYDYRLFDLPINGWTVIGAMLGLDFMFYWFHRASHKIRWMWASHAVHHSSEHLNFTTSFRMPWLNFLSFPWLFWLPLVLIGFHPLLVWFALVMVMTYQSFIHSEAIPKLGPLEWILNTPSHHRVHHATNPQYLDHNYGGILSIYDRLLGTFCAEDEKVPCKYGVVDPVRSHNPLYIQVHDYIQIARDLAKPYPLDIKLRYLLGKPGWSHDGSRMTTDQMRAASRMAVEAKA